MTDTTDLVARLHTLSTALLPMEGEVGKAWNVPNEAADTIERLTRERNEVRDGREARHRAWLEAKARIAELITLIADVRAMALEDAAKVAEAPTDKPARSREDIAAAIRALKEPT
jgi:hypothetical protein